MKRMHIHIHVDNLAESIRFYEKLYGEPATVCKNDYAKWTLEDPRVNFAISEHDGSGSVVGHLGIEVDNSADLENYNTRLLSASASASASVDHGDSIAVLPEKDARCCYAASDKYWTTDPGGVAWEFFHTTGLSDALGDDRIETRCC